MQENHVICYESRKLKEHEKNYATHDLELAAIVHALKMWRHYLMEIRFELRTDYCGLKYLFDQRTLNLSHLTRGHGTRRTQGFKCLTWYVTSQES